MQFAYCRPSKSSARTLSASGSMLGLAASSKIAQIKSPSLIEQLMAQNIIKRRVFGLMLLNSHEGVLSLGGDATQAMKAVEENTKSALDRIGMPVESDQEESSQPTLEKDGVMKKRHEAWDEAFTWTKVQGAEGWWQILMRGVWVGNRKVLKNQPVVVDVCYTSAHGIY